MTRLISEAINTAPAATSLMTLMPGWKSVVTRSQYFSMAELIISNEMTSPMQNKTSNHCTDERETVQPSTIAVIPITVWILPFLSREKNCLAPCKANATDLKNVFSLYGYISFFFHKSIFFFVLVATLTGTKVIPKPWNFQNWHFQEDPILPCWSFFRTNQAATDKKCSCKT